MIGMSGGRAPAHSCIPTPDVPTDLIVHGDKEWLEAEVSKFSGYPMLCMLVLSVS